MQAPDPVLLPGSVRIRTLYSAISPGTEGGKIVTGKKSLLGKARAKPEQARQALGMLRSMGVRSTIRKVRAKLEGAQPLGYSLCGEVMETADDVEGIGPGDKVACAGGGYANHADQVVVPQNLVAKLPQGVDPSDAAFTTLGAIALQGIRLADPDPGECAAVIGLGVIGQLAGQLLLASGCRVLGIDVSEKAVALARESSSVTKAIAATDERAENLASELSRGLGMDMVLICAGTPDNRPVELAGRISRKKGRVVVVGAVGMDIPREDYYKKELRFSVSCSYGAGRYDPTYEEDGVDYPPGYVRWTEGRNMQAVLDLMAAGKVRPSTIVTHRAGFEDAPKLYKTIAKGRDHYCGMILEYPQKVVETRTRPIPEATAAPLAEGRIGIGFLGSGSFAQSFLLPPLKKRGEVALTGICTKSGLSAEDSRQRFGFARAYSSLDELLEDDRTSAVFIATQHDHHGPSVIKALKQGKAVFVEKPLCVHEDELREITSLVLEQEQSPLLMVGFNRRFSRAARLIKDFMGKPVPTLSMVYRINAGRIPGDHWIQDPRRGGGRVIGEVCHFIDLMQFMCESEPVEVYATHTAYEDSSLTDEDNSMIVIRFQNGSTGAIGYFSEGARSQPKERLEVLGGARSAVLNDYKSIELYAAKGKQTKKTTGKGHEEEIDAFLEGLREGRRPIGYRSIALTTLATFGIKRSLRANEPVALNLEAFLSGNE
jgi:polar amino acid transport system substrate-binding protein